MSPAMSSTLTERSAECPTAGASLLLEMILVRTRRKTIRIAPDEDSLLRQLYIEFRIPTDQYSKPQRHAELAGFVRAWNEATGRNDTDDEILHYMVIKRKSGKKGPGWPTLDDDYEPLASPRAECLTEPEWNHLRDIYIELLVTKEIGRDQLAFNGGLRSTLAAEFHRRTGRHIAGELLAALIEAKCKRNTKERQVWPTHKRDVNRSSMGFGDINEIA